MREGAVLNISLIRVFIENLLLIFEEDFFYALSLV